MKSILHILFSCLLISSVSAQNADSTAKYYQQGMADKEARRYREAENQFKKALEFTATDKNSLIELGNVLVAQNRYGEAKAEFLKAEKQDANNPVIIENLGTLSLNLRQWNDAIQYAQKMQQLKIGGDVNFILAKCYYEMENYGQALKYCELAFKDDPKRAETPYIAARSLVEMSNYKKAAGCYEQAIERDSTKVNWMYEAGLVFYAIPDDRKAIYWMEKAGSKGYRRSNDYIENLANAYLNVKEYDKGIELMQEVLQRKPQDMELLFNVADAFYQAGKYQDAINYWDKVLEQNKENANALYMIGMAYQKKGDKQKGQQLCDRAIQMDPSLKNLRQERKMPGGI